ncbi:MAG: phosphatidylglycerol lysyltransferase domain-containing protein [Desulfobacterales bacterium]
MPKFFAMKLDFKPIGLDKQNEYLELLGKCPQVASDYSFLNLWGWAEDYGLTWAWEENIVWIRQTRPETCLWAPVGAWNLIDWQSRFAAQTDSGMKFIRVPEKLAEHWREALGTWRDCESSEVLSAENKAISRILRDWEHLDGTMGGAIMVDGKMAAYTVAEGLTSDTVVIHFEKGDTQYKGIYQAVNQMFLAHGADNFTLVNREQDLNDEGLRKAKLSYHPVKFLRKYSVTLAGLI